jgi:hypothetical protein
MAQVLAAGLGAKALGSLTGNLIPMAADAAQGLGGGLGGAVGSLFGKKGARVGRKIGSGIIGIGRKLFGFQAGGKVRQPPVRAFKKGGVVQVVPAKPKRKGRRKK